MSSEKTEKNVDVPGDADYYYCHVCEWTGDEAPANGDWLHGGESSTDVPLVECNHCHATELLVDHAELDGYVKAGSVIDRLVEVRDE